MNITKYGIIKGGVCQKRLTQRRMRSLGCWMAWDDIKENKKFVKITRGWYKIIKMSSGRGVGNYTNGQVEIGYLRILQDMFPQLIKSGKSFRLAWMEKWLEAMASCEYGFGLLPPKPFDDEIYEKMHGVSSGLVTSK